MKFEKLSDNKIKIILGMNDLKEKNIDFQSFMSNSIESQDLFLDILNQAEREIGFVTNNYNIHIEAFATSDGTFIFTVTRTSTISLPKTKKVKYKRKTLEPNNKLIIYSFDTFDNYCEFCHFLHKYFNGFNDFFENSSLILLDSTYYLIIFNISMDSIKCKSFFSYISEFANICNNPDILANKLFEYGENIVLQNALEIGIKYL